MHFRFYIKSPQDMIDKAFRRAKKIKNSPLRKSKKDRTKEKAINKISTIENVLCEEISSIILSYPVFENLPEFYKQLFREYIFIKAYKRSLKNLAWTKNKIKELSSLYREKIKKSESTSQILKHLNAYYGRISSLLYDLEDDIALLFEVKKVWKRFPVIDIAKPIFVFAGYPNVGKSSLINALSSSHIQVAPYPFTTKHINVGTLEGILLIDTPGILEKRFEKMNEIEKRAVTALAYLSKRAVFVLDASLSSGYEVTEQIELIKEISSYFSFKIEILVINKKDLLSAKEIEELSNKLRKTFPNTPLIFTSATTLEGIDTLKDILIKLAYSARSLKSLRKTEKGKSN